LLHQPAVRPLRVEPTDFDFNEFAALVALTAASDRLRDFIIVTKRQYKKTRDKLHVSSLGLEDALKKGFDAIDKARFDRNEAAHELATQPARVQRQLISADRRAFEEQRWPVRGSGEGPYEDFIAEQELLDAKELADVEARAKLLCDCYVTLVKMGELSFRIEHSWRQAK
jgi:hypothetical protein